MASPVASLSPPFLKALFTRRLLWLFWLLAFASFVGPWAFSTEILLEYEEIAAREIGGKAVERLMRFIEIADQTQRVIRRVSPSFRFCLITGDADDNKFADCAIAAEADLIITADQHFNVLRGSGYKPQPVTPEEFIRLHLGSG